MKPIVTNIPRVYLSRRNLLTLLAKLDRDSAGDPSTCTIIKYDNVHPLYPQTMPEIAVTSVEDDVYYNRSAGQMIEKDEVAIKLLRERC